MKKQIVVLLAVGYAAVLVSGCAGKGREVLARVDGKYTITLGDFNDRIARLPERYQEIINKNRKEFLNEVITDTILYNEAIKRKLDKDRDVKKVLEEAGKKILIARLLQDEVEKKVTVNEREIEEYYAANKDKFVTPEVLRASQVLVKTESEAKDVLAELNKGTKFEEVAETRSVDPSSKIGGDIGYFTRNQLVPEIEEVCFNMKVGDISGVVKTKFGYHVIKLTEKRPPRPREITEVHDAIAQSLERLKKRMLFNELVAKLREKSKISINDRLLESTSKEIPKEPEKENPQE